MNTSVTVKSKDLKSVIKDQGHSMTNYTRHDEGIACPVCIAQSTMSGLTQAGMRSWRCKLTSCKKRTTPIFKDRTLGQPTCWG